MHRRWKSRLNLIIGLICFAGGVWLLTRNLRHYSWSDVVEELRQIPLAALWSTLAGTVVAYLALFAYERISLSILRLRLPGRNIALSSFLSGSLGHTIGFP